MEKKLSSDSKITVAKIQKLIFPEIWNLYMRFKMEKKIIKRVLPHTHQRIPTFLFLTLEFYLFFIFFILKFMVKLTYIWV